MAAALRHSFLFRSPDDPFRSEAESVCALVVVYEDQATRDRAMVVCEHLVRTFSQQVEFVVGWWKFRYLLDAELAQAAARDAAEADVIMVSAHADAEFTAGLKDWMETWAVHRGGREGVLVELLESGNRPATSAPALDSYLRALAQRAHMDFLGPLGQGGSALSPAAIAQGHQPTGPGSHVLRDVPRELKPPLHWGINE